VTAGLISIGTNSTRALVADIDSKKHARVLLHRSTGTRIGEGLKERGHLDEQAMQRTLEAIREYYDAIREFTSDVRVIATSALRRADNAAEFAERVQSIAHAQLQIVSGEEEARFSFVGAVSGVSSNGEEFAVADVGGGSSEYAVGPADRPEHIMSCEVGAVRLTEAFPALAGSDGKISGELIQAARAFAEKAVAPLRDFPHADRLIFVGGTATTTISLLSGKREMFAYADLSRANLRQITERLASLPLDERKKLPGMNPQRADILLAGTLVLDAIFDGAAHERAVVSTNDLLLGYLLQ
jgi:exopolyphosphatase/guanosine-5'-triphosphate,3'-diphosphate pyrophosphatase